MVSADNRTGVQFAWWCAIIQHSMHCEDFEDSRANYRKSEMDESWKTYSENQLQKDISQITLVFFKWVNKQKKT